MSQVCEEIKIACGERRAKTLEHHPLEHEKGARAGGHCPKAIGRLKRVREPQCVLMFERDFITMGREVKARGAGVGQVKGKDKERVSGERRPVHGGKTYVLIKAGPPCLKLART